MSVYEGNVKRRALAKGKLSCKCGSIRYDVEVSNDGEWIMIMCRKCKALLYYNGA